MYIYISYKYTRDHRAEERRGGICQHTSAYAESAYVSIRQHTYTRDHRAEERRGGIRQHTSAYVYQGP